jgi:hypothetical protein
MFCFSVQSENCSKTVEYYEFVLDTDAVGSNLKVHIFHKAIDFVTFVSINFTLLPPCIFESNN